MSAPNHRDRKQVTLGVVGDGGRMPRYVLDLEAVASSHVILAAALCVVAGCGAVVFGRLRAGARGPMGTSWLLVGLFAAGAAGFQFAVVSSEPTPPVSPLTGQPVSPP
ncbi:MAG: hypothetical protein ACE5JM_11195, partial [Armatimonadota bacterium]